MYVEGGFPQAIKQKNVEIVQKYANSHKISTVSLRITNEGSQ